MPFQVDLCWRETSGLAALTGLLEADPNGDKSGASYVVYGHARLGASGLLELAALDGANGFVLNGVAIDDRSGRSVSGAGDMNDNGVDDLYIGAWNASPNGPSSGASYIVFGQLAVSGSVQGMGMNVVGCIHLDSAQQEFSQPAPGEQSWDCEMNGLDVQLGNRVVMGQMGLVQ